MLMNVINEYSKKLILKAAFIRKVDHSAIRTRYKVFLLLRSL